LKVQSLKESLRRPWCLRRSIISERHSKSAEWMNFILKKETSLRKVCYLSTLSRVSSEEGTPSSKRTLILEIFWISLYSVEVARPFFRRP
jgi:hypothetical protein